MTINATTKARFTLFNRIAKDTDDADKTYPLMFGSIENADFKINVSAFLKENPNTKAKFLSLVIRNENDEQTFSGTLHRSTKAGKEDTYFGYISEQYEDEVDGNIEYTSSEWQLLISAKVKVAEGSSRKYIGGDVYPKKAAQVSTAAPADADLAF